MTIDVSDLDLDEELAQLAQDLYEQLAEQGDALVVRRPAAPAVETHPQRHRSRRAWGLVAAAAALVLIVVSAVAIGRSSTAPSNVAAEGSTTTATPTEPWRLTLDPPSGFALARVFESEPNGPGAWQNVDGTMMPIRRALSVWAAPDHLLQPPVLAIETTSPPAPIGAFPGTELVSINGRAGYRSLPIDGVAVITFQIDATHSAQVGGWGIDAARLTDLVSGSALRSDGRVELAHEPDGLVRHDVPDTENAGPEESLYYIGPAASDVRSSISLAVRPEPADGEMLRVTMSSVFGAASLIRDPAEPLVVEQLTVRGQPAVLSTQNNFGVASNMLSWAEPELGRTVVLSTTGLSRDEILALVDHLQPVDDAAWSQLLERCPRPSGPEAEHAC